MKLLWKLKYAIAVIAIASVVACAEEPLDVSSDLETEAIENPDYEVIRSMGYQTEGIVEEDEFYVVEGDILLRKAIVDSLRRSPMTRQVHYADGIYGIITLGREDGIRVKITSDNIPDPELRNDVRAAIDIWNAVPNCPVYFHKIELVMLRHNVNVTMDNMTAIASATPPNYGTPGDMITINTNIKTILPDSLQRIYALVHEFGHILGLGHTDLANTSFELQHIPGTPDWDAGDEDEDSVMFAFAGGRKWGDWEWDQWGELESGRFTAGDLAAIQSLYGTPIWSSEIVGLDATWPTSRPTYTVNVGTNLIDPEVSWYVNNTLRQSGSSLSFTPTSLPLGAVTLKAKVVYGEHESETTKTIIVADPVISGSNDPEMNTEVTYSIPTTLPVGVTFTGWTVSGSGYTVTGGLYNPTLTISFSEHNNYTIFANFSMPGDTFYFVSKTIDLTSLNPLATPTILANKDQMTTWGETVIFHVGSPQAGVTYQWISSGVTVPNQTGSSLILTAPSQSEGWGLPEDPGEIILLSLPTPGFRVRCRAVGSQSQTSAWSNEIFVPFNEHGMLYF
jgi:hypothetical protein